MIQSSTDKTPVWQQSLSVGNITLKNRIIYPPFSTNWGTEKGMVIDDIVKLYENLAKGGCAMIVVAGTAVSVEGRGSSNQLCLFDEKNVPGFTKLAKVIKENNCVPFLQIFHAGGQANYKKTGHPAVAPSEYVCDCGDFDRNTPARALTIEEIAVIKEKFIHAAELAAEAGFVGVELHLAHGYLLHQFLSEHTNKRTDQYGGTLKNRMRLVLEIIEGIKERVPNLVFGVRVSGEDYVPDGVNEEANKHILPILEQAGVAYFSVVAGIYTTSPQKHKAMMKGEWALYAKGIKQIVNKPVIAVGKILGIQETPEEIDERNNNKKNEHEPDIHQFNTAEYHLSRGHCELVAIGRGLLSDPQMVNKVLRGEKYDPCIQCHQCMYLKGGRPILSCPVSKLGIFEET